jgi:hypothetical protein
MKYINDIYSAKVFHWLMFLKNNNLGFLRSDSINKPPHKIEQDDSIEAVNAYHEINDQVIQSFGIEESFLAQKNKEQDIAMLKLDFIINGGRQKRTMWRIKELEIQTPEEHNKIKYDIENEIGLISRALNMPPIDIKKFTVHQYLISKNSLKHL